MIQTRLACGVVLRLEDTAVSLISRQPCHLQLVDRTTGRVFKETQMMLSQTTRASNMFSRYTRSAMTDDYSAIGAAERAIAKERWGSNSS